MANLFGMFGARYASGEADTLGSLADNIASPSFDFLGHEVEDSVQDWIEKFLDKSGVNISDITGLTPVYNNFMKGVSGSPVIGDDELKLMDASLDMGIPFPLLVGRKNRSMDLIFICHSNGGETTPFEKAVAYFKRNNISYPSAFGDVTKESLTENDMAVFNDPREDDYKSDLPVFVYIPFTAWRSYTDVIKFSYTKEQIEEIISDTDELFDSINDEIVKVLQALAVKKGDTALATQLEDSDDDDNKDASTETASSNSSDLSDDEIDALLDDALNQLSSGDSSSKSDASTADSSAADTSSAASSDMSDDDISAALDDALDELADEGEEEVSSDSTSSTAQTSESTTSTSDVADVEDDEEEFSEVDDQIDRLFEILEGLDAEINGTEYN